MDNMNKSSEEVDLGQLFLLIGAAFNKVVNGVSRLFKFFYFKIIDFFIFVQTNFLKFVIAGVVGFVLGLFLDMKQEDIYRSTMTVEPNFGSTRQLYSNISMYNELVRAEDTIALAKIFGITPSESSGVLKFSVKALVTKNRMLSSYNKYLSALDSTSRAIITFKDYAKDFDPLDAQTHSIIVDAKNERVAKSLEKTIISYISNNPYYKSKKETTYRNIEGTKRILVDQLKDIDTLKKIYREVIINQSQPVPANGGTNISFSENQIKTKEFELLKETREISKQVEKLNIDETENKNIINVVSNFPERGVKFKDLINTYKVLLPLVFILSTFFILLILKFNKYLNLIKK